jgi:hypothetical protein
MRRRWQRLLDVLTCIGVHLGIVKIEDDRD